MKKKKTITSTTTNTHLKKYLQIPQKTFNSKALLRL